ncbi:MAG: PEP-CTERM sorting domain-containing protein [Limisphaerales bacterium]
MKRTILLFSLLFSLHETMLAQGTLSVPLRLNVDFSPTPGSPGTHQLSGDANYFLNGWNYDTSSPEENVLDVYVSLGANPATDGWIFQKNGDGSLTPIFEITNELYFADSPFPGASLEGSFPGNPSETYPTYIYSESYQLTADQVQSLLSGDWYAEMSYGGDTYLGNLTPVPEPSTLALGSLALGLIAIARRQKRGQG